MPHGDPPVGLGQAHLRPVEQYREQRPVPVGLPRPGQPAGAAATAASPLPRPYQPGRFSRVCAQANTHGIARRSSRPTTPMPRRAGRDPMRSPLISSSGLILANHSANPWCLHQRPVGASAAGRHPVGRAAEPLRRGRVPLAHHWRRGQQHGRGDLLQVPLRDRRVAVPGEDDLALLGDLEPAVHRPGRLGQHGPPGRAAAPAERAAAAVEQGQPHVVLRRPAGQRACASYSRRVALTGPSSLAESE